MTTRRQERLLRGLERKLGFGYSGGSLSTKQAGQAIDSRLRALGRPVIPPRKPGTPGPKAPKAMSAPPPPPQKPLTIKQRTISGPKIAASGSLSSPAGTPPGQQPKG